MRSVFRLTLLPVAAACAALLASGCGGGGGGGTTPVTASSLDLVGNVVDSTTGNPINGAAVQLAPGTGSTTTDAKGTFKFDNLGSTFSGGTVSVTAGGFSDQTANVTVAGGQATVAPVAMTPVGTSVSVPSSSGGTVQQSVAEIPALAPASLQIPADALDANTSVDMT